MRLLNTVKKITAVMLLLSLLIPFTACGSKKDDTVIRVGTSGTYAPFTYYDGDKLTGYDIEVVQLLESRMDGVKFEFVTTGQFEGLVAGLDAGQYEMVAQQIAQNAERREKYLFPEYGYTYASTYLVVHGGETRTDLADFEGETFGGLANDFFRRVLDEENDGLGGILNINTYEDYSYIFMDIDNGRIAGTLNDDIVIAYQTKYLGLNVKCVGEPIDDDFSYFLLGKNQTDLQKKIDKALEEVINDGSLSALCIKWLGADYTGGGK